MKQVTDQDGIIWFYKDDGSIDGWGVTMPEGIEIPTNHIQSFVESFAKKVMN